MSRSLLVVAGEISGDMHVAPIVEALQRENPDWSVWGVGGDALRRTGMDILYDVRDMAVLGLYEVLKRYGFFRRVFNDLVRRMEEKRPDAVLLVDYPGFNLRFAREAHRRGIKVIYYICPQVWAWHRSRMKRMAQWVDHLLVIFPFEVEVFKDTGLRVDFVGHPLVAATQRALVAPAVDLPWPPGDTRVAVLPGSRRQEIERILPVMLEAAERLKQQRPSCTFLIAAPSARIAALIEPYLEAHTDLPVAVVQGETRQVLRQARAAMVASGTATIETALMECPMIVVYKTAPLTYWFGKRLIRVPYLGMVNIVADKLLCPEFLQEAAMPTAMAAAMQDLIDETPERAAMLAGLQGIAARLGDVDAAATAAKLIGADLLEGKT